jgi:hypothetical protein
MSSAPQYTLPGIVHYLQAEWTRNERDRILWANEREEMKATISNLQSENARLRRQLQNQAAETEGRPAANGDVEHATDVDSLIKARVHLRARMDEVMYLLRGSGVGSDRLGVTDYNPLAKRRELPVETPRNVARAAESPAVVETVEIDVDETEPEIESDNETIAGNPAEDEEKPLQEVSNDGDLTAPDIGVAISEEPVLKEPVLKEPVLKEPNGSTSVKPEPKSSDSEQ